MGCVLILAAAAGAAVVALALRLWLVLHSRVVVPRESVSLMAVAGSGGHTTELLRLLGHLSAAYAPRHYVLADTDEISAQKIHAFELSRADRDPSGVAPRYFLHRIPRSREVRQPWLTTVLTTLHAACLSLPLTLRVRPDLVLCNGPGTCVPVCAAAVLLGVLGVKRVTLVYVESLCRVEHLSLTGRLLRPFADYFLVQWPALKAKYPSSVYLGRIV
ncbi:UDP-N-acetylglucosamine transferase subunit ALG14 homolog isoform X1 [Pipistrellus kuhlii]|uniref:UDP-N-acetylglucosamine transferase subunit ALG14 n=1 Tax=Pipistrellus kuhlii TaxID=59472 RepID=A0A7J7TVF8_PIPKU|nr:UDP-N-acetylglucosamine transferase subunit ALG14 homolog isoform X1 [Pipistrellus kuhlii]KAF6304589.1 ALG14 UDP-N-acetylglucosaminyltransferase subunit [Pipistrellus kuhlii]